MGELKVTPDPARVPKATGNRVSPCLRQREEEGKVLDEPTWLPRGPFHRSDLPRNPTLRESDQFGALSCCFGNEFTCFVDRALQVEPDGLGLRDGDFDCGWGLGAAHCGMLIWFDRCTRRKEKGVLRAAGAGQDKAYLIYLSLFPSDKREWGKLQWSRFKLRPLHLHSWTSPPHSAPYRHLLTLLRGTLALEIYSLHTIQMQALRRLPRSLPSLSRVSTSRSRGYATMGSTESAKRHVFAPLGQRPRSKDEMKVKGIVFDMDGTLCKPDSTHPFIRFNTLFSIPRRPSSHPG